MTKAGRVGVGLQMGHASVVVMTNPLFDFDPENPALPGAGFFGMDLAPEDARVVIIPAPFDATTSFRPGTAGGPEAMREASHQLDFFDIECGRPWAVGIATLPPIAAAAANSRGLALAEQLRAEDLSPEQRAESQEELDGLCEAVHDELRATADRWMRAGKLVATVGGDHSVAFGAISAAAEHEPGLGILQIDAHADLREGYEGFAWSHASIMDNVTRRLPWIDCLVQVGVRDLSELEDQRIQSSGGRIQSFFDRRLRDRLMAGESWLSQCEKIVSKLPDRVYVSFDIDGLEPGLCPKTGTPVPGGLAFDEACLLLKTLVRSGRRIVGIDLCEVGAAAWDANVGARILYKLIGFALLSQARSEFR